jgi:hypothetical protein
MMYIICQVFIKALCRNLRFVEVISSDFLIRYENTDPSAAAEIVQLSKIKTVQLPDAMPEAICYTLHENR